MSNTVENAYDVIPYVSQAFAQSHPDRLATTAQLFGMTPAPLERCRVLELGCAAGGNLVPTAMQYPDATFVGLDLSARQIADGKAMIADLGITNVDLRQMDLIDVDASLGTFDYIIAHGVFSWVPPPVQAKILEICKQNLAPNGVAYVSYNTYPGWRMRGMIRDMMGYHSGQFKDAVQQVQQARALLDFLQQNVPTENNPYGILLKQEVDALRNQGDYYIAHEHLEVVNDPVYFHEFAGRAAMQGLQYLGEAEFHTMLASNFPPQVVETLRKIAPDIIRMEQYMDFLRNRVFRQTLLVHQNVVLNRNIQWDRLEGFAVASPARPTNTQVDFAAGVAQEFKTPRGSGVVSHEPIVKSALSVLAECWPQAMTFAELRTAARIRLISVLPVGTAGSGDRDAELLGAELLNCVAGSIVELHAQPARLSIEISARPRVSVLARYQASKGMLVTNLRHEPTALDEFNRQLLPYLDGKHDHASLLELLAQLVGAGTLTIRQHDKPVTDAAEVRTILIGVLPQTLQRLARSAMLEA
ncbi:MAG: class I SAM-dependent methyltransferase [Betaproteobacteria bacterium]